MDTEELKEQAEKLFETYINMYFEGLKKRFSKEWLRSQFKIFPDPIGKFAYCYLFDVYDFPDRKFQDVEEGESLEDWQMAQAKQYAKDKMSECVNNFAAYMGHCLVINIYLDLLGIDEPKEDI